MESPFSIVLGACTFAAILSPFLLIAIREAVKFQRQEVITDLAEIFDVDDKNDVRLIPSFEFVKYKYFVGSQRSRYLKFLRRLNSPKSDDYVLNDRYRQDFATRYWIISSSPFSAITGILTFYLLDFLLTSAFLPVGGTSRSSMVPIVWPRIGSEAALWLFGICAAFSASYLVALRNLYRAVKNFDLSPGTITNETLKIVLATILAPVITIVLVRFLGDPANVYFSTAGRDQPSFVVAAVIAGCFVAGAMPDVALRRIIQRDHMKNYKQEEGAVFRAAKITPPEIIDGIDTDIRVRLNDHHIYSTQNLAAANPLMLFVETPFGVYQIMDWVAQAQLCCSVGRERLILLWAFGIRTLFDLERLADRKDPASEKLLIEVGRVILGSTLVPPDVTDPATTAAVVRASIELRLDDPHVQRLRQIYIAVCDRLGSSSKRFQRDHAAPAEGPKAAFAKGVAA